MTTNWTIDAVREALAAKKISARELAREFYQRIAERNPELNAYLTLCEERAYAQADRMDAIVASGKPLPALAGVPIAIKDVISTRGVRTTCGSKILENYIPPYDATAVERLEAAGAVILGKDQLRRICHGQFERELRLWPSPKSGSDRPRPRRLERRIRRSGCGRPCRGVAGYGYRRIDPAAGIVLRNPRHDGKLRTRFPLRTDRLRILPGPHRPVCDKHSRCRVAFCK